MASSIQLGLIKFDVIATLPSLTTTAAGSAFWAVDTGGLYLCTLTSLGARQWSNVLAAATINGVVLYPGGQRVQTRSISGNYVSDSGAEADFQFFADTTGAPLQITLPAPLQGRIIKVADSGGNAAANNITVVPLVGGTLINGGASSVISVNRAVREFTANGTNWFVTG